MADDEHNRQRSPPKDLKQSSTPPNRGREGLPRGVSTSNRGRGQGSRASTIPRPSRDSAAPVHTGTQPTTGKPVPQSTLAPKHKFALLARSTKPASPAAAQGPETRVEQSGIGRAQITQASRLSKNPPVATTAGMKVEGKSVHAVHSNSGEAKRQTTVKPKSKFSHVDVPTESIQENLPYDDEEYLEPDPDGDINMDTGLAASKYAPNKALGGSQVGSKRKAGQWIFPEPKRMKPTKGGLSETPSHGDTSLQARGSQDLPAQPKKPRRRAIRPWHKPGADQAADLRAALKRTKDVAEEGRRLVINTRVQRERMQKLGMFDSQDASAESLQVKRNLLSICVSILARAKQESSATAVDAVVQVMGPVRTLEFARMLPSEQAEKFAATSNNFLSTAEYATDAMRVNDIQALIDILNQNAGENPYCLNKADNPLSEKHVVKALFAPLEQLGLRIDDFVTVRTLEGQDLDHYKSAMDSITGYEAQIEPLIQESLSFGIIARDTIYSAHDGSPESIRDLPQLLADNDATVRTLMPARLESHAVLFYSHLRSLTNHVGKQKEAEFEKWVEELMEVARRLNKVKMSLALGVYPNVGGLGLRAKE